MNFSMDSKNKNDVDLLERFNKRDRAAFGEVYSIFYEDLLLYALSLYDEKSVDPQDAVHDTFMKLWRTTTTKFD